MKLAFFGTEAFSVPSLNSLVREDFTVSLVVTKPDTARGRGRQIEAPAVKQLATKHGLPVIQPRTKTEILELLRAYGPIDMGVVVAYGMILPPEVIRYFPLGLLNIHASLLPAYRGPSPIEAAILNADEQTGVTLMQIEPKMDAGNIYTRRKVPLTGDENRVVLYRDLSKLGAQLLTDSIPKILDKKIVSTAQDESLASYTKMISKSDGEIDWSLPASQIERQIRAYLGWPGSYAQIWGRRVTITSAKVIDAFGPPGEPFIASESELAIYTSHQALVVNSLIPAGKHEMSGSDFVRGHRPAL